MAAEEAHRSRSPKKNRGINWPDEATEALLEFWAEESIQLSLEHSKSSKETRAVYENLRVCHVKPGLITRSHPQASFSEALTSHVRHRCEKTFLFPSFSSDFAKMLIRFLVKS